MAKFFSAILIAEHNEGGYCNVPGDRGGETYMGIARNDHPEWPGWNRLDKYKPLKYNDHIDDSTLAAYVIGFYKEHYWDKMKGDEIIDQAFASYFFDWYINSQSKAVEKLHGLLGIEPLKGIFGAVTLEKANEAGSGLLQRIHGARKKFYLDHVAAAPEDKKFLKGWLARCEAVYEKVIVDV